MLVYNLLSVALAFLWSVQAVSSLYIRTSPSPTCTNPVVRREWRTISTDEKADWIRAMNVRKDDGLALIVLLTHIRNPVLVAAAS